MAAKKLGQASIDSFPGTSTASRALDDISFIAQDDDGNETEREETPRLSAKARSKQQVNNNNSNANPPNFHTCGHSDEPISAPRPGSQNQNHPCCSPWRWTWTKDAKDYVCVRDGVKYHYTYYQKAQGNSELCLELQKKAGVAVQEADTKFKAALEEWEAVTREREIVERSRELSKTDNRPIIVSSNPLVNSKEPPARPVPPTHRAASLTPITLRPSNKKHFEEALEARFETIKEPRRFFVPGRVFKTVWFEPYGEGSPVKKADLEWTETHCQPFYSTKPFARFRWFVVARRRLHHSLCFTISTYGGPGSLQLRRGRGVDFVVLHSSEVPAPNPYPEEGIKRQPLSMIIEEKDQYISPLARLDCSRIYTVEDNLRVMKFGRLHPDYLEQLQEYFRESVA